MYPIDCLDAHLELIERGEIRVFGHVCHPHEGSTTLLHVVAQCVVPPAVMAVVLGEVARQGRVVAGPRQVLRYLSHYTHSAETTLTIAADEAHLSNEGDLHSLRRESETRLIRIEGVDLTTVKRDKFEIAA
jgi:hypothetical protein